MSLSASTPCCERMLSVCWLLVHTHTCMDARARALMHARTFTRHWLTGSSLESWKAVGDPNTPLLPSLCPTPCFQQTRLIQSGHAVETLSIPNLSKYVFTPGAPSLSFSVWNDEFAGAIFHSLLGQNEVRRPIWLSGHLK